MTTQRQPESPRPADPGNPSVRIGVLVFPGSNDDRDMAGALEALGAEVEIVWHKDSHLPEGLGGIAIPGGFSYGDYLRAGAMARFSPIMRQVERFASAGRPVLGVCNGFQVLCETGLLPGALVRNRDLRFVCRDVDLRIEDPGRLGGALRSGESLRMPIKHGEGAYVPGPNAPLRVAFRYLGESPNGSTDGIAGVVNGAGNVLGMMPHPEHAVDPLLAAGTGGVPVLESLLRAAAAT